MQWLIKNLKLKFIPKFRKTVFNLNGIRYILNPDYALEN